MGPRKSINKASLGEKSGKTFRAGLGVGAVTPKATIRANQLAVSFNHSMAAEITGCIRRSPEICVFGRDAAWRWILGRRVFFQRRYRLCDGRSGPGLLFGIQGTPATQNGSHSRASLPPLSFEWSLAGCGDKITHPRIVFTASVSAGRISNKSATIP